MDFSYYHKINNMYLASNKKETELYQAKRQILSDFKDGLLPFSVKIEGKDQVVAIMDSSKSPCKKLISKPDETFNVGDNVEWNSEHWIVIEKEPVEDFYTKGLIKKCESSLKWLDSQGKIKEAFFTIKQAPNGTVDAGNIITLSKEKRTILIQSNPDTQLIKKGKRFIFDEQCWLVVGRNGLTEGLLELTLDEDQFNDAVDNKTLRIADYYGNIANYTISIVNSDIASIQEGSSLQLNVEVQSNGSAVSKPVTYSTTDASIATVSVDGLINAIAVGTTTITVQLQDDASVNDTIIVTVEAMPVDNFTITINGNSEIRNKQTLTYTCSVFNNGIDTTGTDIDWIVTDTSNNPTTLVTIASQSDDNITLLADPIKTGYIKLTCRLAADNTVFTEKQIKIRGVL